MACLENVRNSNLEQADKTPQARSASPLFRTPLMRGSNACPIYPVKGWTGYLQCVGWPIAASREPQIEGCGIWGKREGRTCPSLALRACVPAPRGGFVHYLSAVSLRQAASGSLVIRLRCNDLLIAQSKAL